jgi:hypothetical protein
VHDNEDVSGAEPIPAGSEAVQKPRGGTVLPTSAGTEPAHLQKEHHMSTTAAYVAVQDSASTLEWGGDIDYTFDHFDAPGVDAARRPVLSFDINPSLNGDQDVTLKWSLNGTDVLGMSFSSAEPRAWQEILESNLLKAKNNELIVTLTNDDNTDRSSAITLNDVVILYTNKP